MTNLPQWLLDELPEVRPVSYIDYDPMTMLFTYEDEEFDTIMEAYKYASKNDKNFEYTEAALNTEGVSNHLYMGPTYNNIWIAPYTDQKYFNYLKMIYRKWLETDAEYRKNPKDWVLAYNWIQDHPAFWTRQTDEKTWHWNTSKGVRFYTTVFYNKKKPMVAFETGGHTPGYTETYHDLELDVYAKSFEKAYVKLAKRIDKFFNVDGTEKEGVRDVRN